MTAYNRHLLSQGAHAVARESAARDERAAVVALLRREADYGQQGTSAPDLLRVVAACIENGDHHR